MKLSIAASFVGAVVWLAICGTAAAQVPQLGRLFYTPDERRAINEKRGVVVSTDPAPQIVIVNGMVVRSGRAPILFIDGKESVGAPTRANAARQLADGVLLKMENGQTIAGRPGQIVDLANGRAIENYQLAPNSAGESAATPAPPGAGPFAPNQPSPGVRATPAGR